MRIGLVSPYSFDVPGGVQRHVHDLADTLIGLGHYVSVLAPADEDSSLPGYVAVRSLLLRERISTLSPSFRISARYPSNFNS